MGSYCYNNPCHGYFFSKNEKCTAKCTRGARNKENQEAPLKKDEDASQAVQLPLLRLKRFTDVSVILIKFRSR